MFKKLLVFSLAIVTLLAAGCGGKDAKKEAAIKVGATAGPHAEVVEAAQLPRSLQDVDAAAITMNYVMSGGLDVKKQNIFLESKDEPLAVMIIAARNKDKDKAEYQAFVKAYQSDSVRKFIADKYKGTIEPAF